MGHLAGEPAVCVRGAGKCYGIYARPLDRLKQTLWHGKRQFYREFWALRNICFELPRGEAIGIIGRNGSGKSTLLQIIAGTLRPTEGEVEVRGRVAALLELGSGFNPEFTGRENVLLNGSILGLSRREIEERFDDIAAFADIGEFLEMPVKTYSTGMVVRLAFAVQAMLEPDVLIVDEALAVGDAAFQIKCMTHMRGLLERGVSVVLVTHEVNTVRMFCTRAMWLEQGQCVCLGSPLEVTARYTRFLFGDGEGPAAALASSPVARTGDTPPASAQPPPRAPGAEQQRVLQDPAKRADLIRWGSGEIRITGVALDNGVPGSPPVFEHGQRLHLEVEIRAQQDVDSESIGIGFAFRNTKGLDIITFTTWEAGQRIPPLRCGGGARLVCELDGILAPGDYALVLAVEEVREGSRHYLDYLENAVLFRVLAGQLVFSVVLPPVQHQLHLIR